MNRSGKKSSLKYFSLSLLEEYMSTKRCWTPCSSQNVCVTDTLFL